MVTYGSPRKLLVTQGNSSHRIAAHAISLVHHGNSRQLRAAYLGLCEL